RGRRDGRDRRALAVGHRAPHRGATQVREADAVHRKGVPMTHHLGIEDLGYDRKLYILAFDHRGSFEKMVGDPARVPDAKTLIWEGFRRAVEEGAPKESAGVLVDAQYGPAVAREAKAGGYVLALPVEKSG